MADSFNLLSDAEKIRFFKNEGKGYETVMTISSILLNISGIFYVFITNHPLVFGEKCRCFFFAINQYCLIKLLNTKEVFFANCPSFKSTVFFFVFSHHRTFINGFCFGIRKRRNTGEIINQFLFHRLPTRLHITKFTYFFG